MTKVKTLAVIGCGAIADAYYFPALAADRDWKPMVWLVEPSEERRLQAARKFGFDETQLVGDLSGLPADLDVAINATPSHLHVVTARPLLERGANVILEKPLAETAEDAEALVGLAKASGVKFAVNHQRRLAAANRLILEMVRGGKLGAVQRIHWVEGRKFEWPTQSGFNFRRPWVGRPRGAVLDVGVHVLDLISWWLDEDLSVDKAVMDGHGGPECFAAIDLSSKTAAIEVVLSFHNKLANTFEITGDKGSIRAAVTDENEIEFKPAGGEWRRMRAAGAADGRASRLLVSNFIDAVENGAELIIDAESALPALRAIDAVYRTAADPLASCYAEWTA